MERIREIRSARQENPIATWNGFMVVAVGLLSLTALPAHLPTESLSLFGVNRETTMIFLRARNPGLWTAAGAGAGTAVGTALGNSPIGLALGAALGLALAILAARPGKRTF